MTKEDFIKQYGGNYFKFSSFYKFEFNFTGETVEGKPVLLNMGGDPDDVYRVEISHEEKLEDLIKSFGEVNIIVDNKTLS